jgi:hypothetical protein
VPSLLCNRPCAGLCCLSILLTAVQIYNNPQIDFKSELFIVTTVVAWTYLLHASLPKGRRGIPVTFQERFSSQRSSLREPVTHTTSPQAPMPTATARSMIGLRMHRGACPSKGLLNSSGYLSHQSDCNSRRGDTCSSGAMICEHCSP